MEIKGMITWVGEVVGGDTDRGHWERQEIVVTYGSITYQKKCLLRLGTQKLKVPKDGGGYDSMVPHVGMKGTFTFDCDAHEYNGRWFNSLECYMFKPIAEIGGGAEGTEQGATAQGAATAQGKKEEKADDLPY